MSGCGKSEKQKCEAKGDGWSWDATDEICKEKTSGEGLEAGGTTLESCNSKPGYVWDANNSQCKKIGYFMLTFPEDNDEIRNIYVSLLKNPNDPGLGHTHRIYLSKFDHKCVRVHESHISNLLVMVKTGSILWTSQKGICGGLDSKCELGVYELASEGNKLNKVEQSDKTDCVVWGESLE